MQERLTRDQLVYQASRFPLGITDESRAMASELLEARELIREVFVDAYCRDDELQINRLDSDYCILSAKCMRYLASIGRLEIESDDGVRVVGRLKP